ncbi:hypothetical protein FACS18948_5140 [Clostridia bacterium]|nr:hypothetical protein FACS18948_5140 [Clostridia bacterium]
MKQAVEPVPLESIEQQYLFQWARMQSGAYPELGLMYHIPNGGSRNKAEAARLKGEGVRAGVPDICLPVARRGKHALYVELKRRKGGRVSGDQSAWLAALEGQGNAAHVCEGWDAAADVIMNYLREV